MPIATPMSSCASCSHTGDFTVHCLAVLTSVAASDEHRLCSHDANAGCPPAEARSHRSPTWTAYPGCHARHCSEHTAHTAVSGKEWRQGSGEGQQRQQQTMTTRPMGKQRKRNGQFSVQPLEASAWGTTTAGSSTCANCDVRPLRPCYARGASLPTGFRSGRAAVGSRWAANLGEAG